MAPWSRDEAFIDEKHGRKFDVLQAVLREGDRMNNQASEKPRWAGAGWASVVGLISALTACTVFAVALVLALLIEFIVTGSIGEWVDDSFVRTGGRICGATSLLTFVVAFVVGGFRR